MFLIGKNNEYSKETQKKTYMKNLIDYYESILDEPDFDQVAKDIDKMNKYHGFTDNMIEYVDKKYHWDCEETRNNQPKRTRSRSTSLSWKVTYRAQLNHLNYIKIAKDIYDWVVKYIKDNDLTELLEVGPILCHTYFVVYSKVINNMWGRRERVMLYFYPKPDYENRLILYYDSKKF